jgi:2-polyprenyl-6-methoxyphenol hydroxylase-like FAD-dependent oxidoreductase
VSRPARTVVILGGGLAGLTLAIQLRRQATPVDVVVLERRRHPVPAAAHKVGESTVEIGANYFEVVLGLKEHLTTRQLKKFGFRFSARAVIYRPRVINSTEASSKIFWRSTPARSGHDSSMAQSCATSM